MLRRKICVFNKLGIVASLDTSSRLGTHVVEKRIVEGVRPSLQLGMLCIATIDNVDILQSHAVVSNLDATRSWHGTSVQCIQPLPLFAQLSPRELVNCTSIPDQPQSPIPIQRAKRRRRTLKEVCSPHTHMVVPRHKNTEDTYQALTSELRMENLSCPSLSLNHFLLTGSESTHSNQLQEDIHKSMLLKYFRQKWMFVVGDAKVYNLLQSIRFEYGNHLDWLIPLPGDWHLLYNYQKVLVKGYGVLG